jgi:hypothetical protein
MNTKIKDEKGEKIGLKQQIGGPFGKRVMPR